MIDLGYDEGGAGEILLVSLQFGDTSELRTLKEKWNIRLGNVAYFHSKEFKNISDGVFSGLDRGKRLSLLNDLSDLIHKHIDLGVTVRIDIKLYDSITTQAFRSNWGTAYSYAAQMGLLLARNVLKEWGAKEEHVNILIEEGHRNVVQVVEQFLHLKKENEFWQVNEVGFASKKNNAILQAADMLAYGEWANMKGQANEIYNVLHIDKGSYQALLVDCNQELIEVGSKGIEALKAYRKDYWLNNRIVKKL